MRQSVVRKRKESTVRNIHHHLLLRVRNSGNKDTPQKEDRNIKRNYLHHVFRVKANELSYPCCCSGG